MLQRPSYFHSASQLYLTDMLVCVHVVCLWSQSQAVRRHFYLQFGEVWCFNNFHITYVTILIVCCLISRRTHSSVVLVVTKIKVKTEVHRSIPSLSLHNLLRENFTFTSLPLYMLPFAIGKALQ